MHHLPTLGTKHFHCSTIFCVQTQQQLSRSYITVLAGFVELLFSLEGDLCPFSHLGTHCLCNFSTI